MSELDKMINICVIYATRYVIICNEKKSKIIVVHGKRRVNTISNIVIKGKTINVDEILDILLAVIFLSVILLIV